MTREQDREIFTKFETIRKRCYNDLTPELASNLLLKVSSLYANIIEMAIDREMEYNRKYDQLTDIYPKVTEARAKAKATVEYEEMKRMEGKVEVTKELIRSLKYLLKVKLNEKEGY